VAGAARRALLGFRCASRWWHRTPVPQQRLVGGSRCALPHRGLRPARALPGWRTPRRLGVAGAGRRAATSCADYATLPTRSPRIVPGRRRTRAPSRFVTREFSEVPSSGHPGRNRRRPLSRVRAGPSGSLGLYANLAQRAFARSVTPPMTIASPLVVLRRPPCLRQPARPARGPRRGDAACSAVAFEQLSVHGA